MRFEFATATRIVFGPGTLAEVAPAAARLGSRALIVLGLAEECAVAFLEGLRREGLSVVTFRVRGEPDIGTVMRGTQRGREAACDLVIGLGGGSALDTGKAIAILLANGGEPLDYLEVIGGGQPFTRPAVPYIAIPTTAGTGAEVTANAVLASPQHRVKVSLRSPLMLPRLAVVDPELTYSLPPPVTASTGLDALTQLIEPYVTPLANPLTDAICREGMGRVARSLRRAYQEGGDASARQDMALASLMGGLALANAKLGTVHGLAGVIGGMVDAPHGMICARLLPLVTEANIRALRSRAPDSMGLVRYDEVARILTGSSAALAADGVAWIKALCADLAVPGLSEFGLAQTDFSAVIAAAQKASSTKGNPIALTDEELWEVLDQAL